jgi:hypothetical protein
MPITLPALLVRPWITPTTPVRPMPVTISSQPNSRSLSATMPAVRCTSKSSSGVLVEIAAPDGDLVGHVGDAVDDGHET